MELISLFHDFSRHSYITDLLTSQAAQLHTDSCGPLHLRVRTFRSLVLSSLAARGTGFGRNHPSEGQCHCRELVLDKYFVSGWMDGKLNEVSSSQDA